MSKLHFPTSCKTWQIVACALGFCMALALLFFGGYRLSSYDRPLHHVQYQSALSSRVADRPLLLLNEAMAQLKEEKPAEAKKLLSDAYEACLDDEGFVTASRKRLAACIKFRQGNLLVHLQDVAGAVDAYCESLRLDPNNLDAKYNLELLLLQTGGGRGGKPIVVPGSGQKRNQGI